MEQTPQQVTQHLNDLKSYLRQEQPMLAGLVDEFRQLDTIAYRMGLQRESRSFADQVSWWPLISVLGTFSAGKSTFINDYLEFSLQRTGHQAVDDKFSVICYAADGESKDLPGTALDADPRFPFFSISQEIDEVAEGEGRRLDSYLQLKTCPSERVKGKIFVDSPGFDADDQRTATLQIADRIIERSDLVLVFFDAHRPEPGAIRDTLEHLVEKAIDRHDATKFIYILNQIDVTADENNLEDVVAAWQRALAQKGLTAGRFYRVFSLSACAHIENEEAARRLQEWREQDMEDLNKRIDQVGLQRVYRVADSLRKLCIDIEETVVPDLISRMKKWRRFTLLGDAIFSGTLVVVFLLWMLFVGNWDGLSYTAPDIYHSILDSQILSIMVSIFIIGLIGIVHFGLRNKAQQRFCPAEGENPDGVSVNFDLKKAFLRSTRLAIPVFWGRPAGWHFLSKRKNASVYQRAGEFIRKLNDEYIRPQGEEKAESDPEINVDQPINTPEK